MEIITIESRVIKWSHTEGELIGKIIETDNPAFGLTPNHPATPF